MVLLLVVLVQFSSAFWGMLAASQAPIPVVGTAPGLAAACLPSGSPANHGCRGPGSGHAGRRGRGQCAAAPCSAPGHQGPFVLILAILCGLGAWGRWTLLPGPSCWLLPCRRWKKPTIFTGPMSNSLAQRFSSNEVAPGGRLCDALSGSAQAFCCSCRFVWPSPRPLHLGRSRAAQLGHPGQSEHGAACCMSKAPTRPFRPPR